MFGEKEIVTSSIQPICDAARILHRLGYTDDRRLTVWHEGSDHHADQGPIRLLAETPRSQRPRFAHTQRIASYSGPTTLPASGQPTQNETPTREPAAAALHPWETGVLDIANCERTEFVVALNDGEAAGTRVETWPPEVRAFMDQHVRRWVEENKETRNVRAMTVAAPKYDGTQSCVLILHHSPKHDAARVDSSERRALHAALPGLRGVS
ncbi:MAG: hypothetical protein ACLQFW_09925 [Xanthobacteraceae bacterium]